MDHSRYRDTGAADRRDEAIRRMRSISVGVVAAGAALTAVIGGLAATSDPGRGGTASTPAAPVDAAQLGGDGGQLQPPDQIPSSAFDGGRSAAVTGGS